MVLSILARRALTAAIVAAAGAAGSYAFRQIVEKRSHRKRKEDRIEHLRWEGEGGSPPDLTAAAPHHRVDVG